MVATFTKIEKKLQKLTEVELKDKIETEHYNLVKLANSVRKSAKLGPYAQISVENSIAEKYNCEKVGKYWVQMYLNENQEFKIPKSIINFLKK